MAEKFYIADEALGGNEREYVKSDKNAEVGDYIVVTKMGDSYSYYDVGHVGEVVSICNDGDLRVNFAGYGNSFVDGDGSWFVGEHSESEYDTLTPSGNVRIDGERIFRMVDRKAEVGDKVINTVGREISIVSRSDVRDDNYIEITDEDRSYFGGLFDGEYYVIEPVDSEEPPKPIPPEADDVTALIANLSVEVVNLMKEVVKLRKQVEALSERTDSNAEDIRTFGEEFTGYLHTPSPFAMEEDVIEINGRLGKLEELTEMITDDIVTLDERTQPEELAETVLGNITIRRSMYGDY